MGTPHPSKPTIRVPPPTPLTSGCATEANGPPDEGIHLHCLPSSLSALRYRALSLPISLPFPLSISVRQTECRGQFKRLPGRAAGGTWRASGFEVRRDLKGAQPAFYTSTHSGRAGTASPGFLFCFHVHKIVFRYLKNKLCVNKNHMSSRKWCIIIIAVLTAPN